MWIKKDDKFEKKRNRSSYRAKDLSYRTNNENESNVDVANRSSILIGMWNGIFFINIFISTSTSTIDYLFFSRWNLITRESSIECERDSLCLAKFKTSLFSPPFDQHNRDETIFHFFSLLVRSLCSHSLFFFFFFFFSQTHALSEQMLFPVEQKRKYRFVSYTNTAHWQRRRLNVPQSLISNFHHRPHDH